MSQRTILVADNDSSDLSTIAEQLQEAGYNVITASNAEETLLHSQSDDTDLAIIDIDIISNLDGHDSRQMWEQIRIHTLYLTNSQNQDSVELAVNQGALGYLIKPMENHQLLPAVKSALECASELKRLQLNEGRLSDAIQRNREISVAIGIYMERFHTTEQEAFEALRSFARNERRKLVEIARELIQVTEGRNSLINRINHTRNKNKIN